jgi:hypothetical protein
MDTTKIIRTDLSAGRGRTANAGRKRKSSREKGTRPDVTSVAVPDGGSAPRVPPHTMEPLLTIPDLAGFLRISPRSLWRSVAAGDVQVLRFGRAVRVTLAEARRIAATGLQCPGSVPPK